jgi:hypothetical protein
MKAKKLLKKFFKIGSLWVIIFLLSSASSVQAALTIGGTAISGTGPMTIDGTNSVSLGASTATGITVGKFGITTTFPGNVTLSNLLFDAQGNRYATSTTYSFSYPFQNLSDTISLLFGTTTDNTWSGANIFNGALTFGSLNGPLNANNGLVSATTSVGVLYGGTGLTSAPSYGNILVGNSSGGYTLTATSSLGFKISCQPGIGDGLNAIPAGTYLQTTCMNDTGVTVTISAIRCFTDNNGASTMDVANGAGTSLLTSAITCGNSKNPLGTAGTQSVTVTLANNDSLSFTFISDGTSKQTTWVVTEY